VIAFFSEESLQDFCYTLHSKHFLRNFSLGQGTFLLTSSAGGVAEVPSVAVSFNKELISSFPHVLIVKLSWISFHQAL